MKADQDQSITSISISKEHDPDFIVFPFKNQHEVQ